MSEQKVLLKDIVGRAVAPDEARDVAEYLLACLTHVTNARPLFGVVDTTTRSLEWTAGGADFHEILGHAQSDGRIGTCTELLVHMGAAPSDVTAMVEQMNSLPPGGAISLLQPIKTSHGRAYRIVMRRRHAPNDKIVQFSILDITAFREAARRVRAMAQGLLEGLSTPLVGELSTAQVLEGVLERLDTLFTLEDDVDVARLAEDLSADVTQVVEKLVEMLRVIETAHRARHWQPRDLDPRLRPVIPVHSAPVGDWRDLHAKAVVEVNGDAAITGIAEDTLKNAYDFITSAANTMIIAPQPDTIFALNGKAAGEAFDNLEDFVRALGVEENSQRGALRFFEGLKEAPALGVFYADGQHVEAWGRPGLYGGWQAMFSAAPGQNVDVPGLFHGLKNLLLHLQVLYVVKTVQDVDQVRDGLQATQRRIRQRLNDLDAVARTGRRGCGLVYEQVGQWLAAAKQVEAETRGEGQVHILDEGLKPISIQAVPGEMEDTLAELVRNAFQHGARTVEVHAAITGDHLRIRIVDDGRGFGEDKLEQIKRVVETRAYDPALSTREDGTGNGLLAAANAVSAFVDGHMEVDHGPGGHGAEIRISLKVAP